MSVNSWGTLRESGKPLPPEDETTEAEARAARSAAGPWSETLGRYGNDPWNLPGFGESGPKCGVWFPESVCDSCGHLGLGTHRCRRKTCSNCWTTWAREASVRGTLRLQAFRHTQPDNHKRQAAHAVVSAPEGAVRNEREFYDGRKKAAEIAEKKGFRGFAVIPHPWRVKDEAKAEWKQEVERNADGDPAVGVWVWLRNEFEEEQLKKRIYWSPHYHIIGVTTADMEPGKESDEWLYEFLRSLTSYNGIRDEESHSSVYSVFRYLLSHTGQPAGSSKQSVTWYGDMANSVFVEDATESWQMQKPSEGVRNALLREIEKVAGVTDIEDPESDESGAQADNSDHMGDCPCDDCDGVLIDVFDVKLYLRHNDPPPAVSENMIKAYEWRLGHREPPPGLKHPQTEQQARDVFAQLTDVSDYQTL